MKSTRYLKLVVFCCFFHLTLFAQNNLVIQRDNVAMTTSQMVSAEKLRDLLTYFAGNDLKGRGTLQPGIEKARGFILGQLKTPKQTQSTVTKLLPYSIIGTTWDRFTIKIENKVLNLNQDFWLDPSTGNYRAADTRKYKFKPKTVQDLDGANPAVLPFEADEIVAFDAQPLSGAPNVANGNQIRKYFRLGARVLVLIVPDNDSAFVEGVPLVKYRSLRRYKTDSADTKENARCIIYLKEKKWLEICKLAAKSKTKDKSGAVPMEITAVPKQDSPFTEYNVLHLIKGEDTTKTVVLSAHYDHLGWEMGTYNPGADDDGSGSMGLLAIASAFNQMSLSGWRPHTNIAFIWFSGEERGLLGSDAYSKEPYVPMKNTLVDINIDMIGRYDSAHAEGDRSALYVIGSNFVSQELDSYVKLVNERYTQLPLDYTYNTPEDPHRYYFRSDHYNFAKNEVPCVFFFNGVHSDYHRPTDTAEKIDYLAYEKRVKLTLFLAWHLAQRTQFLPSDGLGIK